MIKADIIAKRRVNDRLSSSRGWYRRYVTDVGFVLDEALVDKDLHVLRKTPKRCSCWECGNPRKYSGELTVQERKARLDDFKNDGANWTPFWEEEEFGPAIPGSDVARIIP